MTEKHRLLYWWNLNSS